jgi:hypothetical protein
MVKNVPCSVRDGKVTLHVVDNDSTTLLICDPERMLLNNDILLGSGAGLASPRASCKLSIHQMLRLLYQA